MNARSLKFALGYCLLLGMAWSCHPLKIVEKPIIFDQERETLSLEYLQQRHGITQTKPTIDPKMIVLHYTVIPTLEATFRAFNSPTLPSARPELKGAGQLNVSSQYCVDQDGTVYHFLPDTLLARHVIGLNYCSIGVENVGDEEKLPLTKAQIRANAQLVKYLVKKYPEIEYLIGHSEYTKFEKHPLWKETDPNYRTKKSDPGEGFMETVRQKTRDLGLKGAPE